MEISSTKRKKEERKMTPEYNYTKEFTPYLGYDKFE